MTPKQRDTFDAAAKPLMDWLATNIHPHASVIVTSEAAELVEGLHVHRRINLTPGPEYRGVLPESMKIPLIKVLRTLTGAGLKEAKEASETTWALADCPLVDRDGRRANLLNHREELEAVGAIIR